MISLPQLACKPSGVGALIVLMMHDSGIARPAGTGLVSSTSSVSSHQICGLSYLFVSQYSVTCPGDTAWGAPGFCQFLNCLSPSGGASYSRHSIVINFMIT